MFAVFSGRGWRLAPARIRCGFAMRNWPTLSNCNLTGCAAKRILSRAHEPSKAEIVAVIDDPPATEKPRPKPPRRLGLPGKLFLRTISRVNIAGILRYVPALRNFRVNRLSDQLA